MSGKRFEVLFYGDVINCVKDETGKEYNLQELISILTDQQATITELQDILFAKEKTIDRLENTLLHLTEADGNLEKNRKITELANIGYNVKMVLSNDKEQLAKVINEQQATISALKEENEQLRKKLEQIYSFKGQNCRCDGV